MFSPADAVTTGGQDAAFSATDSSQSLFSSASSLSASSLSALAPSASTPSAFTSSSFTRGNARSLAFIDRSITDFDTLAAGIENAEIVFIDVETNGIAQISETLAQYSQPNDLLESVHIFSHGSAGRLQLGSEELSADSLSPALADWGDALSYTGDLLLYGCDVAAGEVGQDFISEISRIVGVDVAASNNVTGLDGDWILEATVGTIEAEIAIDSAAQQAFLENLNILGAGGFESGSRDSGPWSWWNAGSQEQIVAGQGMNGSRAARLSSGQSGFGQIVGGSAGKTYRLTAHAKTTSQGFSTFGLKFLDGNNRELSSIDIGQINSRDWQVSQVAGRAPAGTAKVQVFGFKWADDGETYFDNVSLQIDGEMSAPRPLTDTPSNQPSNNQPTNQQNNPQQNNSNNGQVSVFLLGGQSNMVGLGRNSELPGNLARSNPNVKIWQDSSRDFIALRPGFSNPYSGDGPEFGPELTFGDSIQGYNGKEVYLIKHATGSTNLVNDWDPDGANNREYDTFVNRVDRALADLRGQGISYSIDGMLWMQGEADSYSEQPANEYRANLTAFIRDMRDRYNGGLKFAIGQLHNSFDTAYDDRVRAAQYSVAAADGNTVVANTNGFGLYGDRVHYNTQGQISLGYSFANAIRQ